MSVYGGVDTVIQDAVVQGFQVHLQVPTSVGVHEEGQEDVRLLVEGYDLRFVGVLEQAVFYDHVIFKSMSAVESLKMLMREDVDVGKSGGDPPNTCHVFTRLFTLNTPWYFLDFAPPNKDTHRKS